MHHFSMHQLNKFELLGTFGSSPLTNSGGILGIIPLPSNTNNLSDNPSKADIFNANERGLAMALFASAPFLGVRCIFIDFPIIIVTRNCTACPWTYMWRLYWTECRIPVDLVGQLEQHLDIVHWFGLGSYVMAIFSFVMLVMHILFVPETYAPVWAKRILNNVFCDVNLLTTSSLLARRAKQLANTTGQTYITKYEVGAKKRTTNERFKVRLYNNKLHSGTVVDINIGSYDSAFCSPFPGAHSPSYVDLYVHHLQVISIRLQYC